MKIYPFGAPDAIDMIKCPYHDACVHYGCPELCPASVTATISPTTTCTPTFSGAAPKPSAAATTAATSA